LKEDLRGIKEISTLNGDFKGNVNLSDNIKGIKGMSPWVIFVTAKIVSKGVIPDFHVGLTPLKLTYNFIRKTAISLRRGFDLEVIIPIKHKKKEPQTRLPPDMIYL
jgi:hypothetical protein